MVAVASDSEETRAQILTAAIAEFSQHGFEGARVDAIAQRSSMNKQAIYYYFGSKDGLYSAALENAMASSDHLMQKSASMIKFRQRTCQF
jgi:AcrR family transcriptional regulator